MLHTKVPVGVTTVAGYSVTLGMFVLALLAYLKGDRSEQTLGVIAAGGLAGLSFLTTQIGRYAQAHRQIRELTWLAASADIVTDEKVDGAVDSSEEFADDDEPGDDAPPHAAMVPLTDPSTIPPDEGNANARGASS